jgi:hypothetical protein
MRCAEIGNPDWRRLCVSKIKYQVLGREGGGVVVYIQSFPRYDGWHLLLFSYKVSIFLLFFLC